MSDHDFSDNEENEFMQIKIRDNQVKDDLIKRLKKEKKDLKVENLLFKDKVNLLNNEIQQLTESRDSLQDTIDQFNLQFDHKKSEVKELEQLNQILQEELAQISEQNEYNENYRKLEAQVKELKKQLKYEKQYGAKYKDQFEQEQEAFQKFKKINDDIQYDKNEIIEKEREKVIKELQGKYLREIEKLKGLIPNFSKEDYQQLKSEHKECKSQCEELNRQHDNLKSQLSHNARIKDEIVGCFSKISGRSMDEVEDISEEICLLFDKMETKCYQIGDI